MLPQNVIQYYKNITSPKGAKVSRPTSQNT